MRTEADKRTVRNAQTGDAAALEAVTRHCRAVYLRALGKRGITGDAAEDVASEALAVVVRKLPEFRWAARFETWALAILFRVEQRYNEKEIRRRDHTLLEADATTEDGAESLLTAADDGGKGSPDAAAVASFLRAALADCIGRIAIQMREVWLRHRIHGHEHERIAQDLGMKTATVGTRIWRVDGKMRQCLEAKGYTADALGVA